VFEIGVPKSDETEVLRKLEEIRGVELKKKATPR